MSEVVPHAAGETVPLTQLQKEEYGRVICYPRYDLSELRRRIQELKKVSVSAVRFVGEKTAFNTPVLGKGCVGIVVEAFTDQGKVALKIRRVDADRVGMQHEAEMLKRANDVGVGPRLLGTTKNFLLMEFVEGIMLPRWVEVSKGRETRSRIRGILRAILEQCWRLDELGLDHGELSRAPKHIIVDRNDNPYLIDFETASLHRRVSNVTSICQYLFIGGRVSSAIEKKLGKISREELVEVLKAYKQHSTRENFERILSVCRLLNVRPRCHDKFVSNH